MTSLCPVCNGLTMLDSGCPHCSARAVDHGRFNDFLGPYSPYRPIDEIGMTNGLIDVTRHLCVHVMKCPECRHEYTLSVAEWA